MAKVVGFAEELSPASDRVALRPPHADSAKWNVTEGGVSFDRAKSATNRYEIRHCCHVLGSAHALVSFFLAEDYGALYSLVSTIQRCPTTGPPASE